MKQVIAAVFCIGVLAGCASTTHMERAFQACRYEDSEAARDACIERHIADARFDENAHEAARQVALRKGDHRQSVCMAHGASRDDCEVHAREGPEGTAPDVIDVDLDPVYQQRTE